MAGWFELIVVLAFVCGYAVIEWQCRRLDRQREARQREEERAE